MSPPPQLALVVPCYNEGARLPVDRFAAFADGRDVVLCFVDDGSTDDTAKVIASLQRGREDAVLRLDLPRNGGKGEAVRAGVLAALARRPAFVGYWDADLSTPLEAIDDLLAVMTSREGVDLVLGARVQLMGRVIERSALRHYVGRVFATVASVALGLPVYDTQCGAKLLRVGPWVDAVFAEPFTSRWAFDVELIARYVSVRGGAAAAAAGIHEHPLREWRDVPGSKVRPWDFVLALRDVVRIGRRYGRARR